MDSVQTVLYLAFRWAITFVVPAVVWITLLAGLFQLVRDEVLQARVTLHRHRKLMRESPSAEAQVPVKAV